MPKLQATFPVSTRHCRGHLHMRIKSGWHANNLHYSYSLPSALFCRGRSMQSLQAISQRRENLQIYRASGAQPRCQSISRSIPLQSSSSLPALHIPHFSNPPSHSSSPALLLHKLHHNSPIPQPRLLHTLPRRHRLHEIASHTHQLKLRPRLSL
jgi:hypothetical protein